MRSPLAALLRARVPTYGDAIRGAIDELCKIEEHDRRRLVLAPRQKGVVTVRAEFMRQMVRTTRTRFGKPRYEDVAAITNIVFRGEAPQADGRAVRRAVEKRRERLRKITPLRPQQFAVLGGTKNYPLAPSKKPLFGGAPLGSLSRNDGVGRSIAGDEAPA